MKILFALVFLAPTLLLAGGPTDLFPRRDLVYTSVPGTRVRDYRAPAYVVERSDDWLRPGRTTVRETYPGTRVPDPSKPALVIDRDPWSPL